MGIHQARTEAVQEEIVAKMDAPLERMGASVNAWQKETVACQESMEACLESKKPTSAEIEPVVVHEEVPKEEVAVRTEKVTWEPASSRWAQQTAERTDPGRWWVPENVGYHPQRDDPPCRSGTAQGTLSSGTRQGQWCTKNQNGWTFWKKCPAKPECNNGISDRGTIQQLHLRKEGTVGNSISGQSRRQEPHLGSKETLYVAHGQTRVLEVTKQIVGTSIRLRVSPLRNKKRDH
jgi:hypothetical protein